MDYGIGAFVSFPVLHESLVLYGRKNRPTCSFRGGMSHIKLPARDDAVNSQKLRLTRRNFKTRVAHVNARGRGGEHRLYYF